MADRGCNLTMTELLRRAIAAADNLLAIEKATGIHRASLRRFRDGETSLRLDLADKLATFFGIESRQTKAGGKASES